MNNKNNVKNNVLTVANLFTVSRVPLALFVMGYLLSLDFKIAFILYLSAGATDILDGFFARLFNQLTELGALLDRIADKILDYCTWPLIFVTHQKLFILLWLIMALTETAQIALISKIKKENIQNVSCSRLPGKIKMTLRSTAIILLLANLSGTYLASPPTEFFLPFLSSAVNSLIKTNIWFYLYGASILFGVISFIDHYKLYKATLQIK